MGQILHIRGVKTNGTSRSVKVYRYQKSKRVIVKHIGSGSSDEQIKALQVIKVFIADNKTIISRYHELYRVEQVFRVSIGNLKTRPIFHFKEPTIQVHILICFMALVISKHIEIKGIKPKIPLDTETSSVNSGIIQIAIGTTYYFEFSALGGFSK